MGKDDKNSIGWRIASRRQELHFTQAQLAEKTGVSIPTISNIESNKRIPSVSSLMQIVPMLNCSLDYIVLGKEGTEPLKPAEKDVEEEILRSVAGLIKLKVVFPKGEPDYKDVFDEDADLGFITGFPKQVVLQFAEKVDKLRQIKNTAQSLDKRFDDIVEEYITTYKPLLRKALDESDYWKKVRDE